jgi:hypothetical protein
MTSTPRVTYGLGAKVPFFGAVPGRDFQKIDCSGFVREAIRRATTPPMAFPDGSVNQHDWIRAHGFARSSIDAAKQSDGLVRIAFLRPQDSPHHIGHVVLISGARTLESHGGVGPDTRRWDGSSWQAKAFVYVVAQEATVATAGGAPIFAAGAAAAVSEGRSFTVRHGRRYRATLALSWLEQLVGNANTIIGDKLKQVGFRDVVVTGTGPTRYAEGSWNGPDNGSIGSSHHQRGRSGYGTGRPWTTGVMQVCDMVAGTPLARTPSWARVSRHKAHLRAASKNNRKGDRYGENA